MNHTFGIIQASAVTSLGLNLESSTAAINANLDCFAETDYRDENYEPVLGAKIPDVLNQNGSRGYGVGQLIALLKHAIQRTVESVSLSNNDRLGVLVILPDLTPTQSMENVKAAIRSVIDECLGLARYSELRFFDQGSASCAWALQVAESMLEKNSIDLALICGVDSWFDPQRVAHGLRQHRILCSDQSEGLILGEAAAAILVTSRPDYQPTPLWVRGVGVGDEPATLSSDQPSYGRGLRQAYRQALTQAGICMTDLHLRLSDVSGELYFAEDAAQAYASVMEGIMPDGHQSKILSSYVGDTGSVAGLLLLAYQWQLHINGQLLGPWSLIHCASLEALRSVIITESTMPRKALLTPHPLHYRSDPVIKDVVQQHAEDAAFYWLRQRDGLWLPAATAQSYQRFQSLFDAHLQGIRVAGTAGLHLVKHNLERWQTVDEVFVSTYALLQFQSYLPQDAAVKNALKMSLEQVLMQNPHTVVGATAALLKVGVVACERQLDAWWQADEPVLKQVALPAAMQHPRTQLDHVIPYALQEEHPSIRQYVLQLVGEWQLHQHCPLLLQHLHDDAPECRFESLLSLAVLGQPDALNQHTVAHFDELLAWMYHGSKRQFMIWSFLVDDRCFAHWVEFACARPAHHYPLMWSLIWRSDPHWISVILQVLRQDHAIHISRIAGFALTHLTGHSLDQDGLRDLHIDVDAFEQAQSTHDESDTPTEDHKTYRVASPSVLSEFNLALEAWPHIDQQQLDQDGLLYPNIDACLTYFSSLKMSQYSRPVVLGKPIQHILNTPQMPQLSQVQLRIIALYQTVHEGKKGAMMH